MKVPIALSSSPSSLAFSLSSSFTFATSGANFLRAQALSTVCFLRFGRSIDRFAGANGVRGPFEIIKARLFGVFDGLEFGVECGIIGDCGESGNW